MQIVGFLKCSFRKDMFFYFNLLSFHLFRNYLTLYDNYTNYIISYFRTLSSNAQIIHRGALAGIQSNFHRFKWPFRIWLTRQSSMYHMHTYADFFLRGVGEKRSRFAGFLDGAFRCVRWIMGSAVSPIRFVLMLDFLGALHNATVP